MSNLVTPLLQYLSKNVSTSSGSPTLSLVQCTGGQSTPTFYLNYSGLELILRKQPNGNIFPGSHTVDREYTVIKALSKAGFPVPEALLYCSDANIIGTEFYLTKFMKGRIFKDPLLPGIMPEERQEIYLEMIRLLARLHKYNPRDIGLESFVKNEKNYYEHQIQKWTQNYKALEPAKIESMEKLIKWLPENVPKGSSDVDRVCHGDYRLENIIFHETEPKIVGVLDWKFSTLGHPYSDLASNCMGYYIPKTKNALMPAMGRFDIGTSGIPSEKKLVQEYCKLAGVEEKTLRGPEDKHWRYYLSFAFFRLAGIQQNIHKTTSQESPALKTIGDLGKIPKMIADVGWKFSNPPKELAKGPNVVDLLGFSDKVKGIQKQLTDFMDEYVYPNERLYFSQISQDPVMRWKVVPPIMEELKEKAKKAGLWNFFLPSEGHKLTVYEYGLLCEIIGRSLIAPEVFNCSAPDTGNMELLHLYGNKEQKDRWLTPLLNGEIRSCFAMTEPRVASSDATNIETSIVKDPSNPDYYVINGRKWWTTGGGDPRCKLAIVMGKTPNPKKPAHEQQSMILVPFDSEGIKIMRPLTVLGFDDAPGGRFEVLFTNVRVHKSNLLVEEGKGFEIAQGRLGPGRISHCMKLIGLSQRCLEAMCIRATNRMAFGKLLMDQGTVMSYIAKSRIEIEQCRLFVLYAAKCIDIYGIKKVRKEISAIKVSAPNMAVRVIDRAIQIHGGDGLTEELLARAFVYARMMRIADGPDDVHEMSIAKMEFEEYIQSKV